MNTSRKMVKYFTATKGNESGCTENLDTTIQEYI